MHALGMKRGQNTYCRDNKQGITMNNFIPNNLKTDYVGDVSVRVLVGEQKPH